MRFRTYKNTDRAGRAGGVGLWTISTGWWGTFAESEAVALMHKAFDLGITLFDAADTYGNGLSEELIAKAFPIGAAEQRIAARRIMAALIRQRAGEQPAARTGQCQGLAKFGKRPRVFLRCIPEHGWLDTPLSPGRQFST